MWNPTNLINIFTLPHIAPEANKYPLYGLRNTLSQSVQPTADLWFAIAWPLVKHILTIRASAIYKMSKNKQDNFFTLLYYEPRCELFNQTFLLSDLPNQPAKNK